MANQVRSKAGTRPGRSDVRRRHLPQNQEGLRQGEAFTKLMTKLLDYPRVAPPLLNARFP